MQYSVIYFPTKLFISAPDYSKYVLYVLRLAAQEPLEFMAASLDYSCDSTRHTTVCFRSNLELSLCTVPTVCSAGNKGLICFLMETMSFMFLPVTAAMCL